MEKLRTAKSKETVARMNTLYHSIEKEAVKQFGKAVKAAEAKLRSVEKKIKVCGTRAQFLVAHRLTVARPSD